MRRPSYFNDHECKDHRDFSKTRQFLVPEQGVRLAVTVPIFMMIGFYAIEVLEPKLNSYVFTWALWCAMTMVLVSSNEMGGVMTDGIRRFSGALVTGILASSVVWVFKHENILQSNKWISSDAIVVALAGMLVMFFAQVFVQFTGYKRTTVMVCQLFIKCCFVGKISNFATVWSIIIGVCTGVLMISITSVLIFPRSSSYQAMIKLKLALEKLETLSKLTMHELITASISPEAPMQDNKISEICVSMDTLVSGDLQGQGGEGDEIAQLTQMMKLEDDTLRKCEEMMFSIYDTLDSMRAHLKASRNEIYVGSRQTKEGPKWVLLPGAKIFRCICSNPLPHKELEFVQYNIRRVARHLWAVLLSIDHMWDDTVQQVIKQRYPQEVLPQIHNLTTGVLKDIASAFPSQYYVSMKNLSQLEMHVEVMLNISNRWRTRAAIKKNQIDPLAQQGRQRALKRAATRAASFVKRTPQSVAFAFESSEKPVVRTRSLAQAGVSPSRSPAVLASRAASLYQNALNSPLVHKATPNRTPQTQMKMVAEEEEQVTYQESNLDFSSRNVHFSMDLDMNSQRSIKSNDMQQESNLDHSSRNVHFSTDLDMNSQRSIKSNDMQQESNLDNSSRNVHFSTDLDMNSQRSNKSNDMQPSKFSQINSNREIKIEGDDQNEEQIDDDKKPPNLGNGSVGKQSPFLGRASNESNRGPRQMNRMGSIARLVFKGSSLQKEIDPELAQELLQPKQSGENLGRKIIRQLSRAASRKQLKVEVTKGQRKKRRESAHISGVHTTEDIIQKLLLTNSSNITSGSLENLPSFGKESSSRGFFQNLRSSSTHSDLQSSQRTFRRMDSIDVGSMIVDVPLVEEKLALSFPETEEGHTQEARWYSFQFQIDELLDALVELHTAVNNLLEQHLPKLSLNKRLVDRYKVKQYY